MAGPRASGSVGQGRRRSSFAAAAAGRGAVSRRERTVCWSGGDLLSRVLGRSTIGAAGLNGRVRDGTGCFPRAVATRPSKPPARSGGGFEGRMLDNGKQMAEGAGAARRLSCLVETVFPSHCRRPPGRRIGSVRPLTRRMTVVTGQLRGPAFTGSDQANRRISTGRLNALPRLHPRPIDVVVCHAPHARPGFEGGFPLRCLQRLSCPDIATLHRGWRHDRSTSGPSTPVLSY